MRLHFPHEFVATSVQSTVVTVSVFLSTRLPTGPRNNNAAFTLTLGAQLSSGGEERKGEKSGRGKPVAVSNYTLDGACEHTCRSFTSTTAAVTNVEIPYV